MAGPLFEPPVGPAFDWAPRYRNRTDVPSQFDGHSVPFERQPGKLLEVALRWESLSFDQLERIMGFMDQFGGQRGPFEFVMPHRVWSPNEVSPVLESVSGGSLSARTYIVGYTWAGPARNAQTLASKFAQIAVGSNQLLRVRWSTPPPGVRWVAVYASDTGQSGVPKYQDIVQYTRTWQEPASGLPNGSGGSDTAPSVNDFYPRPTFRYVGDLQPVKFSGDQWRLVMPIVEEKASVLA